jgi:nitrogen fixation protein NifQ
MERIFKKKESDNIVDQFPNNHYTAFNFPYFKQIIQAQLTGKIALPYGLGLNHADYQHLITTISDVDLNQLEIQWQHEDSTPLRERAAFCAEMFAMKKEEHDELNALLNSYCDQDIPTSRLMSTIIATASLTTFHLWESLGLSDRSQLGALIQYNFPKLYALNTNNMRWKRFFYRQLCEQGGDYICKAPSCSECRSYAECFA